VRRATCDRRGFGGAGAVLLALLLQLASLVAPASAYEHRQSTPSFGVQFGYGRVFGDDSYRISYPEGTDETYRVGISKYHDEWGPSAHVAVRFVLDRSHALGFGFDDLRYKRNADLDSALKGSLAQWAKFTSFRADYYMYVNRRQKASYYVAPSVGIQQREIRFARSEVEKREFRLLYGGALGMEYFIRRSFSVDLSGRVYGLPGQDGTNLVVQPALGIHIYVI